MAITIEDVAQHAGVSRQTVSRVINGKDGVKPAVRTRVEDAVRELNYVPNMAARRMGGARSFLITALNDRQRTIDNWAAGHGNDWVDQMLHGGMLACEKRGYHMLFELVETNDDAADQLRRILSSLRPDGIILTQPHSENMALIGMLQDQGKPFARIALPSDTLPGMTVHFDDAGAVRAAFDHLHGLGHRRIAYLAGSPDYAVSTLRCDAYRAAMERAGLESQVGMGEFTFDAAHAIAAEWLRDGPPPTAIIAENDAMAFAVMRAASDRELKVPDDLSLVSFEDTPGVRFAVPPLTAIRQPTAAMIARACDLLIDAAEKAAPDEAGEHVLPFELIVRGTSAAPRG